MTGPITLLAVAGCLIALWVGMPLIMMLPFLLAVVLAFVMDLLA